MIRLLIRKWFFDIWDNFIPFVVLNVLFVLLAGGATLLFGHVLQTNFVAALILLGVAILLVYQLLGLIHGVGKRIAFGEDLNIRELGAIWKQSWLYSLGFGTITVIIVASIFFAVPAYLQMNNLLSLVAVFFMFWMLAFWIGVSQYHYPLLFQVEKRFPKIIRKSFILFVDNTGFSIFAMFFSTLVFVLSGISAFILFGPAGAALFQQNALKLRMLKYDYLDENPQANRKKIPWEQLLADEDERVGRRNLKSLIFPWKD